MLRSIATVSISGTLPEKLHAIAAAGYQGVEIFENDLLYYTGTPAEIRQLAADLGLKITLFQPFRDFEGASRAQFAANMARARRKFALMHELGCDTLLLCSNVQPDCSADSELQVADLRALATLAEEEGIAIGYEALAWGTHVNRWQQAWERVRRVDSPALGLVLDSFHILARGDTLDALPSVPVEKITFVQLADAPYMKMDLLEWSRHFRCFPGQGSCRWRRLPSRSPAAAIAAPGRWRSLMTVFAPRRTARRPKMVIVRCCGWRSKPAVGSRRAMPICFHRRRCRSITGWSLSSLPPAPPRRSAWGSICRRWVFSTRKPPLQTGDAVAQRRGADRHQPSAPQLGRSFYQRHGVSLCAMALRVDAVRRLSPAPARWGMPPGRATPGRTKRRSRRSAPRRQPYLSHRRREAIYERDFHLRDG
jgi:4-hydroxyphenylpyruvate dioxygenase